MSKALRIMAAVLAIAFAGFAASHAQAAPTVYKIDKTHTTLMFMIDHLGFSKTVGWFRDIEGTITFNVEDPMKSSADVTVRLASVDTNDAHRDQYLRGEKVFNVEKNPVMTFKTSDIKVTSDKQAKITGNLMLNGLTKPVELEVTLNKAATHPIAKDALGIGFSAKGVLKRSDFGLTDNALFIGDEVQFIIEVEGVSMIDTPKTEVKQ